MIIINPTNADIMLAHQGFILYREDPTPVQNATPNAKQLFYRRNQGDLIQIDDTKIAVSFNDKEASSSEIVIIDTQQGCIQFNNSCWLTFDELNAFTKKIQEVDVT